MLDTEGEEGIRIIAPVPPILWLLLKLVVKLSSDGTLALAALDRPVRGERPITFSGWLRSHESQ